MARKQFVSSMKNAPSRAVSSKEAALQGRRPENGDDGDDDDDVDVDSDVDEASMNGGESPVSSVASSPISSDNEDADGDGGDAEDGDKEDPVGDADGIDDGAAVAVQVMPSSVGRGKQLRFPTAISRGKEARILHNGSDRDGSDSESYASVASDEEEDPGSGGEDESEPPAAVTTTMEAVGSTPPLSLSQPEEEEITYPIKAFRARKRHRPDSGYFSQMSIHVRDCLLSIRDVNTAEALGEEAHHEFRRKLSAGTVDRVPWKQASPPPPAATPSESEKKVPKSSPKSSPTGSSSSRREKATESSSKSSSSSRKHVENRSERKAEKRDRSGKENSSRDDKKSSRATSDKKDSSKDPAEKSKSSKPSKSSPSSSSSTRKAEANGNGVSAKTESKAAVDVLCAKCNKSVADQKADEDKRRAEASDVAAQIAAAVAAAKAEFAKKAAPPVATAPVVAPAVSTGTFAVPTTAGREISQIREDVARLSDEARSLKHQGNRCGSGESGAGDAGAQGRYYLRSSAKFFQHALLLADLKAAYREAGDERHARSYGDACVQTLAQTSSLIESTVRKLRSAGNMRLVAVAYKLASIVELTIYRLQHTKLFSLYSDLYTPGRSPDTRQNGTTPPITGADTQENAVKTLLLKEMEHTMRGFDMWQRYESCRVEVLPRITNPAVIDLTVLFEELGSELGQS